MSRWGFALCLLLPACGGTTTTYGPASGIGGASMANGGSSAASGGSSTASGGTSFVPGLEPQIHRATPTSCPAPPTGFSPAPAPGPYQSCVSDSECVTGANG